MRETILLAWSGGKDSCMALYELQKAQRYEIAALLTTLTQDYDRISMHGVRRVLLERQAASLGLSLHQVYISRDANNEEYEARMREALLLYQNRGVRSVAFGDLFLEDIRSYRESRLQQIGMKSLFPLWGKDTAQLARAWIETGFQAIVTCVDSRALDGSFAGRLIDKDFLAQLPPHVDPCGENGEFHSFAFDGPLFREKVAFAVGEVVLRDGFYFCDLIPA